MAVLSVSCLLRFAAEILDSRALFVVIAPLVIHADIRAGFPQGTSCRLVLRVRVGDDAVVPRILSVREGIGGCADETIG